MSDITEASPRLRQMNDALEASDRLQAEIERLRLTDAEREAIIAGLRCLERQLWADSENLGGDYRDMQRDAATLRGLLDRLSPINEADSDRPEPIATPDLPSTPAKCTLRPEWTSRPYWVDPPSGWRYGFPRLYDPASDGDMTEWLIASGYPEQLARQRLACTFTAFEPDVEK